MDNCPQQWPYGHTKRTESLSDIYLTVICGGDGGASRARQRVKLDGDRGINCHDVVYPSQRRQRLPCGVLPPLAARPVIGFPSAVFILLGIRSFLWLSFHTKETEISPGPWGGPPSTALAGRASPPLEAHPWSADRGSHRAAHECCAGGGA